MLIVNDRIQVPREELWFSFVRSSGPGGQNVNKVNSKAVMRWSVVENQSLPEDVRQRFLSQFGSRLTNQGELVLASQRYRDQPRNVQDCLDRLKAMLLSVANPPAVRKRKKPSAASKRRRVEDKRRHSEKKQLRRSLD